MTDEILSTTTDNKLPLESEASEGSEGHVTLDELQDLVRQRLAHTNVHILRLPEYATHRYGLSLTQED